MIVLTLGITELTQGTGVADTLDLNAGTAEGIVLAEHELCLGFLGSANQSYALSHGGGSGALCQNVDVLLQAADGKGSVLVEVVGQQNRIHVMLDELIEAGVVADAIAQLLAGRLQQIFALVTDGYDIGVVAEEAGDVRRAAVQTKNTDSDLFHL